MRDSKSTSDDEDKIFVKQARSFNIESGSSCKLLLLSAINANSDAPTGGHKALYYPKLLGRTTNFFLVIRLPFSRIRE